VLRDVHTEAVRTFADTVVSVNFVIIFSEFDYNGLARMSANTRVSARSVNGLLARITIGCVLRFCAVIRWFQSAS